MILIFKYFLDKKISTTN